MNNQPLISVIIPVYNTAKYLHKCVDSVLSQTYTNLEIILVNDGSTDNSGKICDEYAQKDKRIKVIHKRNGGLSSARNAGIKMATGQFLSFIDSDDWVDKKFIEILYNLICKYKTEISCVGYYEVDNKGEHIKQILSGNEDETVVINIKALEMGFSSLCFFACNKLFDKRLFRQINFPEGQLYEDITAISSIFLKTKDIAITNVPLYYYNKMNTASITKAKFSIKKLDYFKATDKILMYALTANNISLINTIKTERAYHITGFFRQMAVSGFNNKYAIAPLQKELRQNIFKLLFSRHKISNKLFAIVCCINFNLAALIYRRIFRQK